MVEITSDDAEYLIEFSAGGKARQRWLPDGEPSFGDIVRLAMELQHSGDASEVEHHRVELAAVRGPAPIVGAVTARATAHQRWFVQSCPRYWVALWPVSLCA